MKSSACFEVNSGVLASIRAVSQTSLTSGIANLAHGDYSKRDIVLGILDVWHRQVAR